MPRRDREDGGGLRPQAYRDERPATSMLPAHEWARTHEPGWTYTAVRVVMSPPALLLYRCRAQGLANVPAEGPMILAPNHFSNFDHFFVGVRLRRRIRFMTKSQFFAANPALDYLFRVSGHFPVRRGHDDEEAFATAHSILDRGGCVGIYAEGGRSRSGGLGEPRRGVGRLALESGVPGGPDGHPWLAGDARVAPGPLPPGDGQLWRAAQLPAGAAALARAPAGGGGGDLRAGAGAVRGARGRSGGRGLARGRPGRSKRGLGW